MKHGDIYWVNLDPSTGSGIRKRRPCLLIGATPVDEARRTVVVIPLSSLGKPRPPLAVPVTCLVRKAVAVCDQIRAVDKSRLMEKADEISREDLAEIEKGLRQVLVL